MTETAKAAPAPEPAFEQRVDVVHDEEGNCWVRVVIPRVTKSLCSLCRKYRANAAYIIAPHNEEHGYSHACKACRKKYPLLDAPFSDLDDAPASPAKES